MNIPSELKYSDSHEWVKVLPSGNVHVGITDYAQRQLSDLVFVSLKDEGDKLAAHDPVGDVESIKAVSEILTPVAGTIEKTNQDIMDDPSLINNAPYDSWFVELSEVAGLEGLMSAEDYAKLLESL